MRKTIKISILLQTHWMTFQGTASQHQPLLTHIQHERRTKIGNDLATQDNLHVTLILSLYGMSDGLGLGDSCHTTTWEWFSMELLPLQMPRYSQRPLSFHPRLFSLLFPSFLFFIAHWLFAVFFFNEKAGNGSRCKNHKCQNPQLWPLNWATSDLNTIFQESLYKANLRNHADDYVLKQNSQHRPGRQVAHKLNMEAFLDSSPTYGDIDLNR